MTLIVRRGAVDPGFLMFVIGQKRGIAAVASDEKRAKFQMEVDMAEKLLAETIVTGFEVVD